MKHPGAILREHLDSKGLTVSAAALKIGIGRVSLSRFLCGHWGISAPLAVRLEIAGMGTAAGWMRRQVAYDLHHAWAAAVAQDGRHGAARPGARG